MERPLDVISCEREPIRIGMTALAGVGLLIAVVGTLALGVFPGGWVELASTSADGLWALGSLR